MGIVAFNWAEGNNNQLTLLMNRDNWEDRVMNGASWNGNNQILSGRCEDNEGTWFCISRGGRVAFLVGSTLVLDHVDPYTGSELYPIEFLESNLSPVDFAAYLPFCEIERHNKGLDPGEGWSYSLIVADMTMNSMVHIWKPVQDDPDVILQPVPFGVHTISPFVGLDSTESPRDLRLRGFFNEMIADLGNNRLPPLEEIAGRFMYNTEGGQDAAVFLDIMMDHPIEELGMQRYGTTSTTALAVERTGRVRVFERYKHNGGWFTNDFDFQIGH